MFHLVFVEPAIPPNTGNAMRLCANTGCTLHLVRPMGFALDARSVRRAGLDYAQVAQLRVHRDFDACLEALEGARLFALETGSARHYASVAYREGDAFLFGSEHEGLPARLLARIPPERHLSIPMRSGSRSLNLANAAALVIYEAWRQLGFPGADVPRPQG